MAWTWDDFLEGGLPAVLDMGGGSTAPQTTQVQYVERTSPVDAQTKSAPTSTVFSNNMLVYGSVGLGVLGLLLVLAKR